MTTKKELLKFLEKYNDDDLIGIKCQYKDGINLKGLEIVEENLPMPWIEPNTKRLVVVIQNIK
ncbi:hypothetical protein [uncultured Psychroserpens sp.]|uniref:hypothetical protein n=1 Tax=uncultured Psychroserpens sp. TaxID=255436 RepID=UPI002619A9CA|nr:hypothetical protein [uncultured Psychroserpens sp.]